MKKGTKGAKTSTKTANLQAKNDADVQARITNEKALKYIYPASCEEGKDKDEVLEKRKRFRQRVRKTIESFMGKIGKLQAAGNTKENKEALKELRAKLGEYEAQVYTPEFIASQAA
jgi:hypothetical protein